MNLYIGLYLTLLILALSQWHVHAEAYFENIYLIAGICDDLTGFAGQFAAAGLQTLPKNRTRHICSPYDPNKPGHEHTKYFLEEGLRRVREEVGMGGMKHTLVVTHILWDSAQLDPFNSMVLNMMANGMSLFYGPTFQKSGLIDRYFKGLGLTSDKILYMTMTVLEEDVTTQVGKELCRLHGDRNHLNIAKLYAGEFWDHRIDDVVAAFQKECPKAKFTEVWHFDRLQWVEDPGIIARRCQLGAVPDIIFTPQDSAAALVIKTAKNALPRQQFLKIGVTGWENVYPDLVRERQILVSPNLMIQYPHRGFWKAIETLISLVEEEGARSNKDIQHALRLPENETFLLYQAQIASSDQEGYMLQHLLDGYNSMSTPALDVHVSTGLSDVSITTFDAFGGKIETALKLHSSWVDPRLAWIPALFPGPIQVHQHQIWTPDLDFDNIFYQREFSDAMPMVYSNGTVEWFVHKQVTFLCDTDDGAKAFPFDIYHCSLDVVCGHPRMKLDPELGFEIIDTDSHFYTSQNTSSTDMRDGQVVVHYQLKFERKPSTSWLRLVVPAVIINIIGFVTFWIPDSQETVALGITSLLCSLTFRSTLELPDTADMTWSEVFLLVNVIYQALVLFIIYCSYNTAVGSRLNYWLDTFLNLRKWHPARKAYSITKEPSTKKDDDYDDSYEKEQPEHLSLRTTRRINGYAKSIKQVIAEEEVSEYSESMSRQSEETGQQDDNIESKKETVAEMFGRGANVDHSRRIPRSERNRGKNVVRLEEPVGEHTMDESMGGSKSTFTPLRGKSTSGPYNRQATGGIKSVSFSGEHNMDESMGGSRDTFDPLMSSEASLGLGYNRQGTGCGTLRRSSTTGPARSAAGIRRWATAESMGVRRQRHSFAAGRRRAVLLVRDEEGQAVDSNNIIEVSASTEDVDWVGRWIIVPSYIVVMVTLLTLGPTVFRVSDSS